MKDERITPERTAASAPPPRDIRTQAAHIIEVTRAEWHHDDLNQRLAAMAANQSRRTRLRRESFDDLDAALAVAGWVARLFGYERASHAPGALRVGLALPGQRLDVVARARSATPAGNDDFYSSGARRQRSANVTRRGTHSCKR